MGEQVPRPVYPGNVGRVVNFIEQKSRSGPRRMFFTTHEEVASSTGMSPDLAGSILLVMELDNLLDIDRTDPDGRLYISPNWSISTHNVP